MANSTCDMLLQFSPSVISGVEELYSTYIANCVINSFLSYTAIMLNVVTIQAIRKTSSLPKPLKLLLLSLAVSDVGVGLLGEPLYISLLVRWLQQSIPGCTTYKTFIVVMNFLSIASFFGIVAISVDRFLAIHLHLRYQKLATHKRVVAVVITIWVFSISLSVILFWFPSDIRSIFLAAGGAFYLFLTTIAYWRIYLVLRRHKTQIQSLQIQEAQQATQNGNMANFASIRKSAVLVFYVYLVFLVCYLPRFMFLAARKIQGPSVALKRFSVYTWTLLLLNSSLNPLIYCWKMRHIRHAIMDILRKIIRWYRNR